MDIWNVYEAQAQLARERFGDIVAEVQVLYLASGVPLKLRLEIVDRSVVDVYLAVTGKYSYHWERRLVDGSIYRHDNAPHKNWRHAQTFPKHFHNGVEEVVEESHISDDPLLALEQVLTFVKAKLAQGEEQA